MKTPTNIRVWFVEDALSGTVLESKYFSTRKEAVDFRGRLGYGRIRSYEFSDGGYILGDY